MLHCITYIPHEFTAGGNKVGRSFQLELDNNSFLISLPIPLLTIDWADQRLDAGSSMVFKVDNQLRHTNSF